MVDIKHLVLALGALGIAGCATPATTAERPVAVAAERAAISEAQLASARKAWGDALIGISAAYESGGVAAATKAANAALDAAYGYNLGPVLFKPTLTTAPQTFRTTREGALAYFVGNNATYPSDTGFALKGWRSVETETAATYVDGDTALWMGRVRLTDKTGAVTTVDKSWGYKRDSRGDLRIVLHHSSLPYASKK